MDLIKREDAIKAIRKCEFESDMPSEWYSWMDTAKAILKAIPSAEKNIPMSIKQAYARGYNHAKEEIALSGEYERAYKRGRESVLLQPKQGEWIPNSPYTGLCSECGGEGNLKNNFCPNCGNPNTEEAMRILASRYHNCDARMKGADDE